MPQRLKEEVRLRILDAAKSEFAAHGCRRTKMSDIAGAAGTATSNLYKYYRDKEAVIDAVLPPAIPARLLRLLRKRVRELGGRLEWLRADVGGSDTARDLLAFWVEHRLAVVILLRGAEETRYAHVRNLMATEMRRLAVGYVERRAPHKALSAAELFVLSQLFERTLDMIADILAHHERAEDIAEAVMFFWRYQLAGLQNLLAE